MFKFFLSFLILQNLWSNETVPTTKLPLWEIGMSTLLFKAPFYRGSKQNKEYLWPVPYFIMRGKKVQAENSFLRGNFYSNEHLSLDLSINAGLSARSAGSNRRQGMPNLYNTFEVGPLIRLFLYKDQAKKNILTLESPLRAVFASNIKHTDHIGFFNITYLNFLSRPQEWNYFWSTDFSIGVMHSSAKLNDHFYGVSENYINGQRPYYKAKGGYSGIQLGTVLTKRIDHWLFLPFFRHDLLSRSSFIDSPLIEKNSYTMFGLGIVYFFHRSKEVQDNIIQVR